jgi:hypothetical protein
VRPGKRSRRRGLLKKHILPNIGVAEIGKLFAITTNGGIKSYVP